MSDALRQPWRRTRQGLRNRSQHGREFLGIDAIGGHDGPNHRVGERGVQVELTAKLFQYSLPSKMRNS